MASLRRWKVATDAEVRQAPNPESTFLFSAPAGKVLKQAGRVVEVPGHGPRLPVLPRGWVDVSSMEALDEASISDSSSGRPSTSSTAAPSSSAASGSAPSTPESKEVQWAADKSRESWSRDTNWSADWGTGWGSSWDKAESKPANGSKWTCESHDDIAWRDDGCRQVEESDARLDSWDGNHTRRDTAQDGDRAWAVQKDAGCDGDRSTWKAAQEDGCDGWGAWSEVTAKKAEEWEDELSVADHSVSCPTASPEEPALPAPKLRLSGDGGALGFALGLEVGACNRSRTPDFGTPRKGAGAYQCLDPDGLNVRTGLELSTPLVMSLPFGTLFQVTMRRKNSEGMVRLRLDCGWTNEFGAPGGTMAGQPVAERLEAPGAGELSGIASSFSATAPEGAAPVAIVADGFDPSSDSELLFVGRLREDNVNMLDCPEVSALFGVGGLQLDEAPPPWAQVPAQPLCFAVSIEAGAPRVLAQSLRLVESGHRFAGTLKSVRRLPASEGREATGIGWVSSLAGMHLYQKDIYIFLGKGGGKGGKGAQDLSELKVGDVVSFEIHVNGKGEPQVSVGTVAVLKSHVAGRGGAVDATSLEIGRTMAVSYD